jgi:TetR/AcrR family transcriptional regulator, transcriptional repressor for nem operon
MPRTPNFNREDMLEKAMRHFWANGYGSASVDVLLRDIGATRFSLYQQFGSKLGLYVSALDRYRDTVVTEALATMQRDKNGLAAIRCYFSFLIKTADRTKTLAHGCLMANTMAEFGDNEASIAQQVDQHIQQITDAMGQALRSARRLGEIRASDKSLKRQAIHLAIFAQGLWLRARAGASAAELKRASETAINMLAHFNAPDTNTERTSLI